MSDRISRPRPLADGITTRPVDRARFRSVAERRLARPMVSGTRSRRSAPCRRGSRQENGSARPRRSDRAPPTERRSSGDHQVRDGLEDLVGERCQVLRRADAGQDAVDSARPRRPGPSPGRRTESPTTIGPARCDPESRRTGAGPCPAPASARRRRRRRRRRRPGSAMPERLERPQRRVAVIGRRHRDAPARRARTAARSAPQVGHRAARAPTGSGACQAASRAAVGRHPVEALADGAGRAVRSRSRAIGVAASRPPPTARPRRGVVAEHREEVVADRPARSPSRRPAARSAAQRLHIAWNSMSVPSLSKTTRSMPVEAVGRHLGAGLRPPAPASAPRRERLGPCEDEAGLRRELDGDRRRRPPAASGVGLLNVSRVIDVAASPSAASPSGQPEADHRAEEVDVLDGRRGCGSCPPPSRARRGRCSPGRTASVTGSPAASRR